MGALLLPIGDSLSHRTFKDSISIDSPPPFLYSALCLTDSIDMILSWYLLLS